MNKRQRKRMTSCHRMATIVDAKLRPPLESRYPVVDNLPWTELAGLRRQYELAIRRGWPAAAQRIRRKSYAVVEALRREIDTLDDKITALFEPPSICSPREVCEELLALADSFSNVEFDRSKQWITVTTEPIELDDVELGAFRIRLDLRRLGTSQPYRVLAVDPHPAASCASTLHPHVQEEVLCEGEGREALQRALADGRLYDFFAIVRQILRTYNSSSAYVTLEDWHGTVCGDCGDTVSDAESCSGCNEPSCGDCVSCCKRCHVSLCGECVVPCEGCNAKHCEKCLQRCQRCEEPFCKPCLTENQCDDCREAESEESEEPPAESPEAAVHTVRTSQVDVPT